MEIASIASRLSALIDHFGLTASAFADKTGVQRSGVSHLISGRNKPSLDFIVKVLDAFPEIDLYWLLIGQGEMIKAETPELPSALNEQIKSQPAPPSAQTESVANTRAALESERIIIFHSDGTFTEYLPKS